MTARKHNIEYKVVVEGAFDARVLNKLFKGKFIDKDIEILESNGYSSALSKAKSLLSFKKSNVILILDTESVDELDVKQKEDFVNFYITTGASKNNFKTFWAIPEFEIIFLNNSKFIEKLSNKKIDNDVFEIAKANPKKMLELLSNKPKESFLQILNDKEVRDEFFKAGLIKMIADYIENSSISPLISNAKDVFKA